MNTLATDGVAAGHDDCWVQVSIKADRTFEVLSRHEPKHNITTQRCGAAQEVVLGDMFGRGLTEIFDKMRMTARLTKTEEQDKYVRVVSYTGCQIMSQRLSM